MQSQTHIFEEIEIKFEVSNFTAEKLAEQGILLVGFRMCPGPDKRVVLICVTEYSSTFIKISRVLQRLLRQYLDETI